MEKSIKISITTNPNIEGLKKKFSLEELRGKKVKDIVGVILDSEEKSEEEKIWDGNCIKRALSSQEGYQIYESLPLNCEEKIENYIQQKCIQGVDSKNQISLCIVPNIIL